MGRPARSGLARGVSPRLGLTRACAVALLAAILLGGTAAGELATVEVSLAEPIAVSDGPSVLPPAVIAVSETILAADGPAASLGAQLAVSESISVSDGPTVVPAVLITVSEVVSVSDAAPLSTSPFVTAPEAITVADAVTIVLSALISTSETVSVSDAIGIEVRNPAPTLTAISPTSAATSASAVTLTVDGAGFVAASTVHWRGSPRPTAFSSTTRLTAAIPATDLSITGPIAVAGVTVVSPEPGGGTSAVLPFTILGADVDRFASAVAGPGETASASTVPETAGSAGVSATLSNGGEDGSAIVTTATYAANPTSTPLFDVGGGFVDLNVSGAGADDVVDARFYYPSTTTGSAEDALELLYFDGGGWAPVQGDGGAAPLKDTTDDLDGTVSGGRFSVRFSATSVPAVTALGGTVFATVVVDTTPPGLTPTVTPAPNDAGWHSDDVQVSWTVADPESGISSAEGCGTTTLDAETAGTEITCAATNGAGLVASASVTIRIDRTAPEIAAPADLQVGAGSGCAYTGVIGTATASDNFSAGTELVITSDAPASFPLGTTTVTWTATDAAGNSASAMQAVIVVDDDAPSITAPDALSVVAGGAAGTVITNAELGTASASDNCGGVSVVVSGVPSGNLFPIGQTVLTWTATDDSGNTTAANQIVTVRYDVCLLYDAQKIYRGATVPIRLQLCPSDGTNLSSAAIVVHATGVTKTSDSTSGVLDDVGNANPDFDFRFDPTLGGTGGYIFNLNTSGYTSGAYELTFTVAGESYAAAFQIN